MRARWLKPEFVKDRKMGHLGLAPAIVYQTLWCMADDGGVARGAAEEIKGEMLVWWEELDVPAVRSALVKLEESGRISGYMIGDYQYWILHNLLKHQGKIHKASKFRHPRPNDVQSSAGVVPESNGTPRYLDTSTPRHLDTSTPSAASAGEEVVGDAGKAARTLITRLNQGMQDNPEIGNALTPVPHGHAPSLTAAEEIIKSGVAPEFAARVIYEGAKRYKPSGRNRQIKSLSYLTASVLDAWEKHNALDSATSTSRPAAVGSGGGSVRPTTGGKTLAAAKLIAQVRKHRNPMYPNAPSADWHQGLSDAERDIVKAFGIHRILNDTNEGTLVSQVTKALEESANTLAQEPRA
jgi:hypothetical protein